MVDHYFTPSPPGPEQRTTVRFRAAGRDFSLTSAAGVFSAERLDPGTAVLLRKGALPGKDETGSLLDLGCGYGPVACVLATLAPATAVWAVDVNPRARDLTADNAAACGVADRVHVHTPEEVPGTLAFSQIWSNPPVRVGKEQLHSLLEKWLPRLTPEGTAWLVVARYLGSDSLQRWLTGQGWGVVRHASQKGYRVLRVTRAAPG